VGEGFKTFFSFLKLGFLKVLDYLPGVDMKDAIAETEQDIANQKAEREQLANQIEGRMAVNRIMARNEEANEEAKNNKTKNALDLKNIKEQQKNTAGLEAANKKQAEEQEKKLNLNANENDLLLDFAKQQGSAYIKDKPASSSAASSGTGALVTEADQKKAVAEAAAKKEEEAKLAKTETGKGGSGTPASTQESPASLLASLNTKMDQLIKFTAQTTTNTYEQIGAVKGLSGNLFKM
jgi:E3 ubiquitin-protein ligase DOA10